MDKYIGKLLDNRYEILEVIGTGGMAVVYKARCHRLNRLVAIKILKEDTTQDEELRRRFHAESQAVAMLSHPNIVSVFDVSRSSDADYIVMELIDGLTLKQYMQQKGVLNWREALHFAIQVAKALEHAHSRGIVHRDIKPHNIMVLKDGSVKVADFGIARITSSSNTLTREALGSVHYISPEQAKGGRVDERTDIYSLGVVLYEMLTGRPPFDGESPVSIAIQHISERPPLPTELNPDIPKGLEQITMHAMCPDLENRYASATELLDDLDEFRKNPEVQFAFHGAESRLRIPTARPEAAAPAANPVRRQQAAAKKPEPSAPRKKTATKKPAVIIVVGVLLALVLISYFLYSYLLRDLFSGPEDVKVPNLVGQVYEEINPEDYPDFVLEKGESKHDDTVPAGQVIEQEPKADKTVKAGSTIILTVSLGSEEKTMPNLVNTSVSAAQRMLEDLDLGLNVKVEYEENSVYVADQVIRTDPLYGDPLEKGDTVTLTVCEAVTETLIPVPELEGLDIQDALNSLTALGLSNGAIRYVDSDLPAGTVTYQSIEQGQEVKAGTVINLQVSLGPEEDPDPQVPEEGETGNPQVPEVPEDDNAKLVTVNLPEGDGTITVTLLLDGVQYGEDFTVALGKPSIQVQVKGSGTQVLDIYFDGVLAQSEVLEFGQ